MQGPGLAGQCHAASGSRAQDLWLASLSSSSSFTRWIVNEISPWLGKRILEVGCGIGTFTVELARGAEEVISLDKDSFYAEDAARRVAEYPHVKVICSDARDLNWLNNRKFDTVVLLDVLEHVENDVALIEVLASKMASKGHLIVKVPAMPSLYSPLDAAIGHCRRYDFDALQSVLRSADLEVVRIWSFNAIALFGWWWNGRVRKRSFPAQEHLKLFNFLLPIIHPVDKVARVFGGISIIAIARRKPRNDLGA